MNGSASQNKYSDEQCLFKNSGEQRKNKTEAEAEAEAYLKRAIESVERVQC